jgi:hypothetical protein
MSLEEEQARQRAMASTSSQTANPTSSTTSTTLPAFSTQPSLPTKAETEVSKEDVEMKDSEIKDDEDEDEDEEEELDEEEQVRRAIEMSMMGEGAEEEDKSKQ